MNPIKTIVRLLGLLTFLFVSVPSFAQDAAGYEINIKIDGYEGDTVFLAFRRGKKTFSRDTTTRTDGRFVFRGETPLPTGIYLVLMPPDNKFFEFIVSPEEQRFSIETKAPDFYEHLRFKGAPDNALLYDYQNYMTKKIEEAQTYQANLNAATDEASKQNWQNQLDKLGKQVRQHQETIRKQHPNKFTSKLIGAFMEPEIPEAPLKPDGTPDETFAFRYFRAHYFDTFDFSEPGFVRTPYLEEKTDYFLDKLHVQSPDTLILAVEYLLHRAQANREVFRFTISHILNKYYRPKIVGLDAVYVYVADNYYRTGIADWVDEETLKKILDEAYMMRGVLVGNPAPEVSCQLFDYARESWTDSLVNLYDIDADYTVVYLWKPGCPACRKMTEELKTFYNEWKDKGVEVYAISSANHRQLEKAKHDILEKGMTWITVADPYLKSRALMKYYGTSLPKIYLLDRNKTIIASRVGATQLPEIIEKAAEKAKEKG